MDDILTHIAAELSAHAWAVIVLIAVPVGAVVGFLVQWRTMKKLRLESVRLQLDLENADKSRRKLELEVDKLQLDLQNADTSRHKLELEVDKLRRDAQQHERAETGIQRADFLQMHEAIEKIEQARTAVRGRFYDRASELETLLPPVWLAVLVPWAGVLYLLHRKKSLTAAER